MLKNFKLMFFCIVLLGSIIGLNIQIKAQQINTGSINLELIEGESCCVYGTNVSFGARNVSFGQIDFTGDFLSYQSGTTWACRDMGGANSGWTMSIKMSGDLLNEHNNRIGSGNVKISFGNTILDGGNCIPYIHGGIDNSLNTTVIILEKDGNNVSNYSRLCELSTTGVSLKVSTNTGQAPGNYQGTIVIDLPDFANASCTTYGVFYDSETDGLSYEGNMGSSGTTQNGGRFDYKAGEQIIFKIGTVTLGNPVIPAANGSVFVTDLYGLARTDITDTNVVKVAKLLQSLDNDANPDNRIVIETGVANSFTENGNISGLNIDSKLITLSKPIRSTKQVVQHLQNTINSKLANNLNLDYSWIKGFGGFSFDAARFLVTDQSGYIYIAGALMDTVSFGSGIVLSESGISYAFVAKLDKYGNGIWARKIDGALDSQVYTISLDSKNNVYIGGYVDGTGVYGTNTLFGDGSDDGFIAKLDTDGNWIWAQKYGVTGDDLLVSIAIDQNDNIFLGGYFGGTVDFGTGITLTSSGLVDAFLARLDTDGNRLWVRKGGGPGVYSVLKSIDVDQNSVYFGSVYQGTVSFGNNTFVSSGGRDNIISKLDKNGNWLWNKKWGGTASDYVYSVKVDSQGNVYSYGYFGTTMNINGTVLTSSGATDVFLVKTDTNGNWLWSKKMTKGLGNDEGWSMEIDSFDRIYASGRYRNTGIFGNKSFVSLGIWDVFYGQVSSTGEWLRTKTAGSTGDDHLYTIYSDQQEDLYLMGMFYGTGIFGSEVLTSMGSADNFVSKIKKRDIY